MEISTSEPSLRAVTRREWTSIIAPSFGALLKWYDVYTYVALAETFSTLFFPGSNGIAAFLASLATFGAGFLVRRPGALLFGRLAVRIGRKCTFIVTIVLTGIATVGVGLLPSFKKIGTLAPTLLVCLRLLQGFAPGGEKGGAATCLAERSPRNRLGFYAGSPHTTAALALLAFIAIARACRSSMDMASFPGWG